MKWKEKLLLALAVHAFVCLPLLAGFQQKAAAQGAAAQEGAETAEALIRKGVAAYEQLDFPAAVAHLEEALKQPGTTPAEMATIHKYLGFVRIGELNLAGARQAFVEALKQDPALVVDPRLRSPRITGVFEEARKEFEAYLVRTDRESPEIRLIPPEGTQPFGRNIEIAADVTDNYRIGSVELYYRNQGEQTFSSVPMLQEGEDRYMGTIFSQAVMGTGVEYYVMAQDAAGNISYEGTFQSPMLVQVKADPALKPWYKKWWVWALAGVVVAGGAGAGIGLAGGSSGGGGSSGTATTSVGVSVPALP